MPIEPDLAELLREALKSDRLDLHTALPAVVEKYDAAKQVADCKPIVRRWVPNEDGDVELEELPVIPNVPVAWTRGGGYSLQLPIEKGDHVWLVFNECDISRWRESGDLSDPGDLSDHDLSYPFAIPAAAPSSQPLDDTGGVAVLDGPGVIRMGGPSADFVALAQKVFDALDDLKSAISGAAVVAGDGGAEFKSNIIAALSGWPPNVAATKLKGE